MTGLYSSVHGEAETAKPELVLLHGWGAHSGVWQTVLDTLAKDFRVSCIDLPGHGHSPELMDNSLDSWTEAVLDVAPEKATWLGWSLGGLVAQRAASLAVSRIEKLILVASTPKFVMTSEWPDAVEEQTFRAFHAEVIRDPQASLLRFIALQTRGSATATDDSRLLRKTLLQPEPTAGALDAGMQLLLTTDLRKQLNEIAVPVLVLGGERDTLVPDTALAAISELFFHAEVGLIKQAGHAPFLSHPNEFCQALKAFCCKDPMQYKEA